MANTGSQEKHLYAPAGRDKSVCRYRSRPAGVGSLKQESPRLRQSRTRLFGGHYAVARCATACLLLITLATAVLLAAGSADAWAAAPTVAPGVHIDPGSPVAKEYAIPLSQARGSNSSGSGQLFGKGITRAPSTAERNSAPVNPPVPAAAVPVAVIPTKQPRGRARPASGSRRPRVHPSTRPAAHASHAAAATAPQLAPAARPPGGGAGIVWMLGVAALVLALGGLGRVALSRHSRRTSTRTS